MSRDSWYPDYGPLKGLYRDRENGWIFGVCAGLAERFDVQTGVVRVIAVASLVFLFWPTVLAYIAATLLIREKPLTYSGRRREYEFWKRTDSDDRWSHS